MSINKMEVKEKECYDKHNAMSKLAARTWQIIVALGFLTFLFFIIKDTVGPTVVKCSVGVLVIAVVLDILFFVLSKAYLRKYHALQKESDEREIQEKRNQKEKNEQMCAKEGHVFEELPYINEHFNYKPELFKCLPLDCCVTEKCSRCGAERKKVLHLFDDNVILNLSSQMECPVVYNGNIVGRYQLSLDLDGSYFIQAKKDIPSVDIKKGELFLVLNPSNRLYYNEEYLSRFPEKAICQTDKIYDDDEMPGLVELEKCIAFIDYESDDILSLAKIWIDTEGHSEHFGEFKIDFIRVPDKGTLRVFCNIKQ